MLHAVIMAGGNGTRFWPLSTKDNPKQCMTLFSKKPLIQETIDNLPKFFKKDNIYVATNKGLQKKLKKILPKTKYIIEPCARNTAGCIGLACIEVIKKDPEAIIFIETADHVYDDKKKYHKAIQEAIKLAEEDKIVTIGIKPSYSATGYGYIKLGKKHKKGFVVDSFREKPNKPTAEEYIKSKKYLWNSGMYIFKAKKMLEEIKRYQPTMYKHLMHIMNGKSKDKEFAKIPSLSIDYAISEKTKDLLVVKANMPWEDIGKWTSLEKVKKKDKEKNIVIGNHIGVKSKKNIIYGKKLIATVGVENMIIVETEKAILICPKDKAENVKKIVEKLKEKKKTEYL